MVRCSMLIHVSHFSATMVQVVIVMAIAAMPTDIVVFPFVYFIIVVGGGFGVCNLIETQTFVVVPFFYWV